MQGGKYIFFNSEFHKTEQPIFNTDNRAFNYGDALFETIHANGTTPQFLELHIQRLILGMKVLKMNIPDNFRTEYFNSIIINILNKNRQLQGARVKITVFRNSGGLYTPLTNEISFIVESSPLENDRYILNNNGYAIDIFQLLRKPVNILSNLKTTNSLIFVLAGIFKKEKNIDDCLILNEKDRVIESISSNIFIVKNTKILTPALSEGCLAGIMRFTVIGLLKNLGYSVNDNCSLTIQDILTADEVFLTNAIAGVRWVLAFRNKRYYNDTSKFLVQRLNEISFNP